MTPDVVLTRWTTDRFVHETAVRAANGTTGEAVRGYVATRSGRRAAWSGVRLPGAGSRSSWPSVTPRHSRSRRGSGPFARGFRGRQPVPRHPHRAWRPPAWSTGRTDRWRRSCAARTSGRTQQHRRPHQRGVGSVGTAIGRPAGRRRHAGGAFRRADETSGALALPEAGPRSPGCGASCWLAEVRLASSRSWTRRGGVGAPAPSDSSVGSLYRRRPTLGCGPACTSARASSPRPVAGKRTLRQAATKESTASWYVFGASTLGT